MPTTTGTTSTEIALSLRDTYTTPLLTKIASGSKIYASDIVSLSDFANAMMSHTHTLTEYTQLHDYGDTVGDITVNTTSTTTIGVANVVLTDTVIAGEKIKANTYNEINTQANNFVGHYHSFDDTY